VPFLVAVTQSLTLFWSSSLRKSSKCAIRVVTSFEMVESVPTSDSSTATRLESEIIQAADHQQWSDEHARTAIHDGPWTASMFRCRYP